MKYHVTVHKENDSWLATVTNLEGAHTFATSFNDLQHNVREMIALIEDLPDGAEKELDLSWVVEPGSAGVRESAIATKPLISKRHKRSVFKQATSRASGN